MRQIRSGLVHELAHLLRHGAGDDLSVSVWAAGLFKQLLLRRHAVACMLRCRSHDDGVTGERSVHRSGRGGRGGDRGGGGGRSGNVAPTTTLMLINRIVASL